MFFIRFTSLLPFWFLYGLCEVLAFLAYYVFRYRRAVVRENLETAFPEKPKRELRKIERDFYRQLLQVFTEFIKAWRFKKEDWEQRMRLTNPEVLHDYLDRGVPIVLMSGHTANWEWPAFSFGQQLRYPLEFLYKPIKKQGFDKVMLNLRTKHGGTAIPKEKAMREVIKRRKQPRMIGFISDQLPSMGTEKHWLDFLNRPAAFYVGAERIATLTQYAVFYVDCVRVKRGRYEATCIKLGEPPYEKGHEGIIADFVKMLETSIHRNPADYLWSHKRWKYTEEEEKAHMASLKS